MPELVELQEPFTDEEFRQLLQAHPDVLREVVWLAYLDRHPLLNP
jgi:hypothetical protein